MSSLSNDELCYLGASQALALFRSREISPVQLLSALISRAETVEPAINAFSDTFFERAHAQAVHAEQVYLHAPERARPLEGIPVALKNEHRYIGVHTTQGSYLCGAEPDTENAPLTQRLLDSGALIHAQTNVPEFYLAGFTHSRRHGTTRNPWNRSITCGGSSGGSAASLAAGMTTLASGSDIAGSLRIPASYCGVVGFKPSYGRVPEGDFTYAANTHNHNGAMARSVRDCALMFNVINGPHACDPATVSPKLILPDAFESIKGLRIAVSYDLGFFDIQSEVHRNTQEVARTLRDLGAHVDEVSLAWTSKARDAITYALGFVLGKPLVATVLEHGDQMNDYVRQFARRALNISQAEYFESTAIVAQMHTALQKVFAEYDVLICPTMASVATPAEGAADAHDDLLRNAMTYPFNLLSRHPVLSIPSGFAANGVPTGLQIVAPTFDDALVMRVGAALEDALDWNRNRPPL